MDALDAISDEEWERGDEALDRARDLAWERAAGEWEEETWQMERF